MTESCPFFNNLSETLRIDVNMDFPLTERGRFLSLKSKTTRFFKDFGLKFFWRPKSATISVCKILIYIDSESSRQIH